MCQVALEYVLLVLGKYLQMLVAYQVYKEQPERVNTTFAEFNVQFEQLQVVFKDVTGQRFKPGQKLPDIPVAEVKPTAREPIMGQEDRDGLCAFLRKHRLLEIQELLFNKGVTLVDVLEMDVQEVEELGIQAYRLRKHLKRAIMEARGGAGAGAGAGAAVPTEPQPSGAEEVATGRRVRPTGPEEVPTARRVVAEPRAIQREPTADTTGWTHLCNTKLIY